MGFMRSDDVAPGPLQYFLSYYEKDPTISNSSKELTRNWVGAFGANIAWPLITLFGMGAYGLVITGLWASWRLFREPLFERAWLQLMGIAVLIVSIMTLGALHWDTVVFLGQEFETGGEIGRILAEFLDDRLSLLGSHTLLIGLFLIALLLSTPFTLQAMIEGISALWSRASGWLLGDRQAEDEEPEPQTVDEAQVRVKKKERLTSPPVQTELFTKKQTGKEVISPEPLSMAPGQYALPALNLLDIYETETAKPDWKRLEQNGAVLEEKLADFGVQGKVVGINPGPVITMYEYAPAPGIKISRIVNLADDLSMALKAISVRVVRPFRARRPWGSKYPTPRGNWSP